MVICARQHDWVGMPSVLMSRWSASSIADTDSTDSGLGAGGELTDAQMDLMKKQTGLTEEQIKDLMKQQSAGQ